MAFALTCGVSCSTVSMLCAKICGLASRTVLMSCACAWKSGVSASMVVLGLSILMAVMHRFQWLAPWSGRSSLVTEVRTTCLSFMSATDLASWCGSMGLGGSGRPVFVAQNRQPLVHISPRSIKVAVPLDQHSAWLGHLPDLQMVLRHPCCISWLTCAYCWLVCLETRSH